MSQAPSSITPEQFHEWRSPRRGSTHPENMTNDVWAWIIGQMDEDEQYLSAYKVNQLFQGPHSMDAGPCWCFSRFGQTKTELPDGRTLFVAGEHEDFYDPDFYIYNDVVVVEKSGEISIFGYPDDVFPPTDFHTATLTGDSLILIGNLSYPQNRKPGQTQVLRLELDSWRISPVETSGTPPGWIHRHKAFLSDDAGEIRVTHGQIDHGDKTSFVENIDDWSLDLQTFRWNRLTKRNWPRFEVFREDKKRNHLYEIGNYSSSLQMRSICPGYDEMLKRELGDFYQKLGPNIFNYEKTLKKELGIVPDLTLFETLYTPPIATEIIDEDTESEDYDCRVHRICIGDVIVRYVEKSHSILVTVEGELPESVVEQLKKDITDKLSALEQTKIVCQTITSE